MHVDTANEDDRRELAHFLLVDRNPSLAGLLGKVESSSELSTSMDNDPRSVERGLYERTARYAPLWDGEFPGVLLKCLVTKT